MFRYCIIITALLATALAGNAQSTLAGRVSDEQGAALPGATVLLRKAADSAVVQATVSDSTGRFVLPQVKRGHYLLQVSFVTYTSVYLPLSVTAQPPAPLSITLQQTERRLQGVTVQGRKPAITTNAGKTTMNVENSTLSQSRSAYDLLKNLPGVTVNKDGEIKIRGKAGVTILIDGEPVEMGNKQLKHLLQSTPGATLSALEVMNTPPASMDAAGNGGAINIVFKKKVQKGLNGSVASGIGAGRYMKTDHSITLSHGTAKWNLNATYALEVDKTWQRDSVLRPLEGDGRRRHMEQVQLNPQRSVSHLGKLVADRYLGEKNTLGLTLSYNHISSPYNGATYTRFYSGGAGPDSLLLQQNNARSNFNNLEGMLRFRRKIDGRRSFSTSLQATRLQTKDMEAFEVAALAAAGRPLRPNIKYRNTYPGTVTRYSFRADYTQDIMLLGQKAGKMEAGVKSIFAEIRNRQEAEQLLHGIWQPDAAGSNRFRYREAIQAGYASAELNVRKWELRAGLRAEYTGIRGDSLAGALLVKQDYLSLFPNVQAGYNFHKHYKLSLSYNRRIDRPEYDQLNPAVRFMDVYTVETGNPYLKPQYSDNIELVQQFFSFIDLTAGYSVIRDPLYFSYLQAGNGLQAKYTTINAGRQQQWFASLSFPVPGIDRWENYQSFYCYSSRFNALIEDQEYREKALSFGASTYNSVKLPAGFNVELNGWYESGGLYGNFHYKPMAEVSVGVSRKLLNDRLNAGLSVNDAFYTGMFRANMITKGSPPAYLDSRTDSRTVKLTLNFRFGKKPAAPKEEQPAGTEQDADRLPSGKEKKALKTGKP